MDLIGCPMITEDFVVSGTCNEQMYCMCESLWEPNMVRFQILYLDIVMKHTICKQIDWLIDWMIVVKGQVGNISAIFMARKVFLVRKKVWTEV